MERVGRKMTAGTKLADRIQLLGYKVKDVADGANVDRFSINDYLNRRKHISPSHLHRLASFLQCEPEAIYE